jgi:enamine deaminase RidA (YjgF/YER057c/UK114 family)
MAVNTLVGGAGQKEIIRPRGVHSLERWPYSHGVKVGNLLFIAGQVALDEELRLIGAGDVEAQSRQVWTNIKLVAEAAGGKVTDVVRVTTFVLDIASFDAIHKVRQEFFPDGRYPTATGVQVVKLGLPGLLLETEAFAVIGSS